MNSHKFSRILLIFVDFAKDLDLYNFLLEIYVKGMILILHYTVTWYSLPHTLLTKYNIPSTAPSRLAA